MAVRTSIRYVVLDRSLNKIGEIQHAQAGSGMVSRRANATVKASASLVLETNPRENPYHWPSVRIKPIITINDEEIPLGVFLPDIPVVDATATSQRMEVSLLDRSVVLHRDFFAYTYGVPAGLSIMDEITSIIASTGEPQVVINDSDAVLLTSIEAEPDDSKLAIINLIAEASGQFSLYTGPNGMFRVDPYVAPMSRGVSASFSDRNATLVNRYLPEFTREEDMWVPNVYIAKSQPEDADTEALVAEAVNDDPNDPYSTVHMGRILPEDGPEMDVKTTGQQGLQAYAERRLQEVSGVQERVVISHVIRGDLTLNDLVRFDSDRHGIEGYWTVQSQDYTLDALAPICETTLRRVKED